MSWDRKGTLQPGVPLRLLEEVLSPVVGVILEEGLLGMFLMCNWMLSTDPLRDPTVCSSAEIRVPRHLRLKESYVPGCQKVLQGSSQFYPALGLR